jgi:hypothetical protein
MKRLPIGEQNFQVIRDAGMLYVDKTEYIHHLITNSSYCFLSRPRRFGKSLTLATIDEIFHGKKHLFEGLWIENNWDWSATNPVVHLSFNKLDYQNQPLEQALMGFLDEKAEAAGFTLHSPSAKTKLTELIQELSNRHAPVVLLVDEYDKPIIDYLDKAELPIAYKNRATLKTFYSGLKDKDSQAALRFFLITGVSKFSQVSIFSDLNYLDDITFDENYAVLTGYTQEELVATFEEHLAYLQEKFKTDTKAELMGRIRRWYNGYSWDGENRVYNPFSILNLLKKRSFEDYWFKTGTATFLMKKVKEEGLYELNNLQVDMTLFDSYDLENMDSRALLFQTGYLTIKSVDRERGLYTLDFPNKEVEMAMHNQLIATLLSRMPADSRRPITLLEDAFMKGDITKVVEIINTMLKDIPSLLLDDKTEHFYHALVHLHFRYLGLFIESEVHTSDGRMDAVVQTPANIYILEFKVNESADIALQQIKNKKYAEKYRLSGQPIVGIGINFEHGSKAVEGWAMEQL